MTFSGICFVGLNSTDLHRLLATLALFGLMLSLREALRAAARARELTVRFLYSVRGVRDLKDAMSRDILTAFDGAGIGIASATDNITGFSPIRLERSPSPDDQPPGKQT